MTSKLATTLATALAALALTACQSQGTKNDVGAGPPSAAKDDGTEREALERKLAIARLRLDQAQGEREAQAAASKVAVDLAREELELTRGKLAQFETLDGPNRKARGELELKRAEDRNVEAAEELAQLEIMYDEQDLEDMTAEFVISRGKRNAERAEMSLAIQRSELEALMAHEMPRELRALRIDVARKESALEKAQADAETARLKCEISVLSAEADIRELEQKLAKLSKEGAE